MTTWKGPFCLPAGVSLNKAVCRQISTMIEPELMIDPDGPWQGAIGAALSLLDEIREGAAADEELSFCPDGESLYKREEVDRSGFYPPLTLKLSDYPDFSSYLSWDQPIQGRPGQPFVEVELFESWPEGLDCYLGIDIGSTAPKRLSVVWKGRFWADFIPEPPEGLWKRYRRCWKRSPLQPVRRTPCCGFWAVGRPDRGGSLSETLFMLMLFWMRSAPMPEPPASWIPKWTPYWRSEGRTPNLPL